MKYLTIIAVLLISGTQISAQNLTNSMDSLSYSVGVLVAQNLKQQGLDKVNSEVLAKAISDVLANNKLDIELRKNN